MSPGKGEKQVRIVCFSEIQWKYVMTRKQQVINRFPAHWRVLFLSSFVKGKRNNFLPEKEGRVVHACVPIFKNFPPGIVRSIFSIPPVRFVWNVLVLLWVRVLLIVTGFNGAERVFYVSNIYYGAILPFFKRSLMFYDCNDDHLAFPGTPRWAAGYFRKVALSADFAITVSSGLTARLRSIGVQKIHRIGNGVDFELFSSGKESDPPEDIGACRRPLIGYSGAIAPWFDFELLDAVAASFSDASILMLGPVFEAVREDLARVLESRSNIHHLGSKPYNELVRYLAALDVCIVPLLKNELMRLADPNKLYEYAAVGKPVVTMRFSEDLDPLSSFMHVAETREEFVEKVRVALSSEPKSEELLEFARSSSWQARADSIAALITDALSATS
jgi:glycosyltransferase involved in cell wall biosynthesis